MTVDKPELRLQLQQLQEELATRESTRHFAHAGVSLIAAFIFSGAAGKLFWDSTRVAYLGYVASLGVLCLLIYAFFQFRRGRRTLADELRRFATLQELRRTLNLDDPASLLPQ